MAMLVSGFSFFGLSEYLISRKRNWFQKIDPVHRSFSTLSTKYPSNFSAFFHHALRHSLLRLHCDDVSKTCTDIKVTLLRLSHFGSQDCNHFDGYLNSFIDFKNILNY